MGLKSQKLWVFITAHTWLSDCNSHKKFRNQIMILPPYHNHHIRLGGCLVHCFLQKYKALWHFCSLRLSIGCNTPLNPVKKEGVINSTSNLILRLKNIQHFLWPLRYLKASLTSGPKELQTLGDNRLAVWS